MRGLATRDAGANKLGCGSDPTLHTGAGSDAGGGSQRDSRSTNKSTSPLYGTKPANSSFV